MTKLSRAAYSFFAAFIGWLVPLLGYLLWMKIRTGTLTDIEFLLFYPLFFTALGWLLVGLPLALFWPDQEKLSMVRGLILAVSATTVTYLALAIWISFYILVFLWWPVLIGLIGGALYLYLVKNQPFQGKTWPFWGVPLLFFPFMIWVVLPVTERYFPYTYYALGEGAIGPEAEWRIIEGIEPGDNWQDLHRRYPRLFQEPTTSIHKKQGNGWAYWLKFDEMGRVTEVEVETPDDRR